MDNPTLIDARTFPVPTTISPQAQRWLASDEGPPRDYPAAEDTDAWLALADRANASTAARFPIADMGVTVEEMDIDGVAVYAAQPTTAGAGEPLYLWAHPGALLVGGGDACRATTSRTAAATKMLTWGIDYRTLPLHPFPAALEDMLAVYRRALDGRDASRVFVGGDSAGGGLAAALLLRARAEGLPMPAALVLNTPQIDLTEAGDTFQTLADVSKIGSSRELIAMYASGADPSDPYLSPLFGDLSGFPPTFLQSGTRDLLLSNTVQMHRRLRAAGVDAQLHVFEAMPHGGFGGDSPEDLEHAAEVRRFLAQHGA